ncbi:MAG: family B DNA polymerase [Fusobacteriaceae bacterium]
MYSDISTSCYKDNFVSVENFKKYWVNTVNSTMKLTNTDDLVHIFERCFSNGDIDMKNTAIGRTHNIEKLKFVHTVYDRNYIISENGVFFANQRQELPPSVNIEIQLGNLRKAQKKMGNYYLTTGDDPILGNFYDLLQNGSKTLMNTYYGILLNKYSKFFNPDLASSITCRGRSTVSVSALTVESILGGYFPSSFGALLSFVRNCNIEVSIMNYDNTWHKVLDTRYNKTIDEVLSHIGVDSSYYMYDAIRDAISKSSQSAINLMFFKNNIRDFINIPEIDTLLKSIATTINSDGLPFLDPNEIPESIQGSMTKLIEGCIVILNGYYWYQGDKNVADKWSTVNTQETIKTIPRQHIALIDTDSNMIAFNNIRDIFDIKLKGIMLSGGRISDKDGWFSMCNLIMTIVDRCIDKSLSRYTEYVNMLPEYKGRIMMKNEFLYNRFILTSRKKNYLGSALLKEGQPYPNAKLDIKGLMFTKSNVNPMIGSIVKDVLYDIAMDDKIDIRVVLRKLDDAKTDLKNKMRTQEGLQFFPSVKLDTSKKIKNPSDYRIVAMDIWNILGLGDEIVPPTSFLMVRVDIQSKIEMLRMKYPGKIEVIEMYLENRNNDQAMRFKDEVSKLIHMVGLDKLDSVGFNCGDFISSEHKIDIIKSSKDVFKFITKAICECVKINDQHDKQIIRHINKVETSGYKLKDLFSNKKIDDKFNDISKYISDKLTHTNPDAKRKISDLGYIAMPLDSMFLTDFILDAMNIVPIISQIDSLAAPIVRELHIVASRNKDDRVILSNVVDYF